MIGFPLPLDFCSLLTWSSPILIHPHPVQVPVRYPPPHHHPQHPQQQQQVYIITILTRVRLCWLQMLCLNMISDIGGLGLEPTDQTLPFTRTKIGHHGLKTF